MAAVETTGVIGSPLKRTYQAGAANIKRGTAVIQGADDNHVLPATANAVCLGFLEEDALNIGDPASVIETGEAVAIIGAAVAAGQYLIANAAGQLIPSTAAADQVIARAISSGAVLGDYITVLITPFIR